MYVCVYRGQNTTGSEMGVRVRTINENVLVRHNLHCAEFHGVKIFTAHVYLVDELFPVSDDVNFLVSRVTVRCEGEGAASSPHLQFPQSLSNGHLSLCTAAGEGTEESEHDSLTHTLLFFTCTALSVYQRCSQYPQHERVYPQTRGSQVLCPWETQA